MHKEIAIVIGHLSWPVFFSAWIYYFRRPLNAAFEVLTAVIARASNIEFSHSGTTLALKDISKALADAQTATAGKEDAFNASSIGSIDLNTIFEKLQLQTSPSNFDITYYQQLAKKDATLAIMGLRRDLEISLENIGSVSDQPRKPRESFVAFVTRLQREEIIELDQRLTVSKLYSVCSAAAHGQNLESMQVEQVFVIATFLKKQMIAWFVKNFPNLTNQPQK